MAMRSSNPCLQKNSSGQRHPPCLHKAASPPCWSDHIYVELARADIALFKFILESCDNLAYLSVLDKYRAMIRLTFAPEARETVERLLESLEGVVGIRAWFPIPHTEEPTFAP